MAYRFSDTSKWQDEWFVELTSSQKLLFLYLCDNCDSGGFYELSVRKLSFDTGLSGEEIKASFKGLDKAFLLSDDKKILFLKNFIKHQKNVPLNLNNKSHQGIFSRFENYKNRFTIDLLKVCHGNKPFIDSYENQGATKPLTRGTGNGIGNTNEYLGENKGANFQIFWDTYGKKIGNRKVCEKKWAKINSKTQDKIINELPKWRTQFTDIQYQPYPETYLNQERWNDEYVAPNQPDLTTQRKMVY